VSRRWKISIKAADRHIILIHTLGHAEAALSMADALGLAITLRSAPGSAHYAGLAFLKALFDGAAQACPKAHHSVILDCGDDAALAHRAMVMGFRRIAFAGSGAMRDKLAHIAAKCGAKLAPARAPADALDLLDSHDPAGTCAAYLKLRKAQKIGKNRVLRQGD